MLKLNEICSAFSVILDLAGERTFEHSKRTAYIAARLADEIGFSKYLFFYGGLLHDIGASGELSAYNLTDLHTKRHLIFDHAQLGSDFLEDLPHLNGIAPLVKYHHEHFNGSGAFKLAGSDIPVGARILHLADQIDLILNGQKATPPLRAQIVSWVKEASGRTVFPDLKDAFLLLSEQESFWLDLEAHNLDYSLARLEPEPLAITYDEFEKFAQIFSKIIDNKSKYTHEHSVGLYHTTSELTRRLGYDDFMQKKLGIAAYLHDLGKLVVPTTILEKPAKLSAEEFFVIKQHPYYTKKVLRQINGITDIANWAGNHHEKINGLGYPERLTSLTQEDEIIAFADIYTALIESRPYRAGLSHDKAMGIIKSMVANKELSAVFFAKFQDIITSRIA